MEKLEEIVEWEKGTAVRNQQKKEHEPVKQFGYRHDVIQP